MNTILALLALADIPVQAPFPAGIDASKPWKLVRVKDGKEVPAQIAGGVVLWLHSGDATEYRLEPGASSAPRVECKEMDGAVHFSYAGKDIFRYNHAIVKAPAGFDPVFDRGGYIHPIKTPGGRVVTNDFPVMHKHHHGIWWAWTSSEFEGRKSDFWNVIKKEGRIEGVKVDETWSGPVFGGFRARHRFIHLNKAEEKPALDETWEVKVYALEKRFIFDLVSTQTCATDQPLVIRKERYGGVGFRGSGEWEGKEGVAFLTSEGKTRVEGHATTAKWCVMNGKVGGADVAVGFLGHPSNFRFPQPMRIHPDEPFFNWAPSQAGDFQIEPGKPYISRYRFVVADGALGAAEMDTLWRAYAEPPAVTLR